jgi:hypothetical protein
MLLTPSTNIRVWPKYSLVPTTVQLIDVSVIALYNQVRVFESPSCTDMKTTRNMRDIKDSGTVRF